MAAIAGTAAGAIAADAGGAAAGGAAAGGMGAGAWGALGSVAGGALGFLGQQSANATNQGISKQQMDWEEYMSDTAMQRRVNDLKAAGLNPMLAYTQGGASTPSYQTIPVQNAGQAAVQGANSAAQTMSNIQLLEAQKRQIDSQTLQNTASAGQLNAAKDNTRLQMTKFPEELRQLTLNNTGKEMQNASDNIDLLVKDYLAHASDFGKPDSYQLALRTAIAKASQLEASAKLYNLEVPEAISRAAYWNSVLGQSDPFVTGGANQVQSVGSALRSFTPFNQGSRIGEPRLRFPRNYE